MLGHNRHASETSIKWPKAGGLMMARLKWYFDPPPLKTLVLVEPPLIELSGSTHVTHAPRYEYVIKITLFLKAA